jgi:dCTP deaminase
MFLSDRDLGFVVRTGQLIYNPPPTEYDTTSIDLLLDAIDQAKVWDAVAFAQEQAHSGQLLATLGVGTFNHKVFAQRFHRAITEDEREPVFRRGAEIILKPFGFFLWQTREEVGTPEEDPRLICFVEGKSTKARTGLLVHMTAPTIHAGWWGKITLEISNLGPFNLALWEGDAIAQLVVAFISSPPLKRKQVKGVAIGQQNVGGQSAS